MVTWSAVMLTSFLAFCSDSLLERCCPLLVFFFGLLLLLLK